MEMTVYSLEIIDQPFVSGPGLFFHHDDDVDYPTDLKGELATMPYHGMAENMGDVKLCVVCGERASGFYFGALVCLPCKVGATPLAIYWTYHQQKVALLFRVLQ